MNSSIKTLLKIHLCLLALLLLHTGISVATGYRLQQPLLLYLKIALYLSGVVLFFKTFRKSGLQRVYFFFYLLSALTAALFSILGGIFMALLATFLLFPIYPRETVYKSDNIIVYSRFQGFMAACCSYEVAEPKCFIFEQYRGIIRSGDPADRQSDSFSLQGNSVVYRHTLTEYHNAVKTTRDTTETISLGK